MNIKPFLEADIAIQLHMLAAIGAFVLGAFVLWRRKGNASHRFNGRIWVGLMMVTALSGFFIHELRVWGQWSPIHIISALVPMALIWAILAARKGDITSHRRIMQSSYVGGMVVAGGFTFLPGRLNHQIFPGHLNWAGFVGNDWLWAIGSGVLVFAYFYLRIAEKRQTKGNGERSRLAR
ncbi:MAG: DUF2306 domain-containing protein [Rhizobiaceae bacterium]